LDTRENRDADGLVWRVWCDCGGVTAVARLRRCCQAGATRRVRRDAAGRGSGSGGKNHKTTSMRIYVAALILMMGAIYLGGCRSTRSLRKVIAAPAVHPDTTGKAAREAEEPVRDLHADSMAFIRTAIEGIERNHIDFTTFSGVMRVHYQGSNGANNEVNAMVRIKKDSIIWIEIYAHAGPMTIKAFQVLVTPDSVKILDRIKKVARLRSVSYLQEQVNLPVDFGTIQDILIGNPIFLDTANILYYRTEKKGYTLFSVGRLFSNFLTLN